MSNKVTGTAFIKANGKLLRSEKGGRLIGFAGVEREAKIYAGGIAGYSENPVAPRIECRLLHMADTSLEEIRAIVDATITFETDGGRTYVLRNAWCSNAIDIDAGEGMVDVTFTGISAEEMT